METFLTNNWIIPTRQIRRHGHEELEHRAVRITVHPYRNVRYVLVLFQNPHHNMQLIQVTAQKTITSTVNERRWTSHSVGTGPGTDLLTTSDLKHNDTIINLRWSLNFLINGHNYVAAVNYKISQSLMLRRIKPSICKIKFSFSTFKNNIPLEDFEFEILWTCPPISWRYVTLL